MNWRDPELKEKTLYSCHCRQGIHYSESTLQCTFEGRTIHESFRQKREERTNSERTGLVDEVQRKDLKEVPGKGRVREDEGPQDLEQEELQDGEDVDLPFRTRVRHDRPRL